MADVEINQGPAGGANWIWAVVVLVLVALLAWFFFAGGGRRGRTNETKIEVNTPAGGASAGAKTP